MATPLTDSINALITYANEVTGESDTNLSDAVHTLASGYGGGSTPKWRDFSGGNIQAIIGNGESYIATNITTTNNGIFACKFLPNQAVSYEYVYSLSSSSNTNYRIHLQRVSVSTTWETTLPQLQYNRAESTGVSIRMKGAFSNTGDIYDLPLVLFRGYFRGALEASVSKVTFYGLNIVDEDNEYIAKLVPWKDDNDVICVKNLVTGDIYYNAGTGTFGYIDAEGVIHA